MINHTVHCGANGPTYRLRLSVNRKFAELSSTHTDPCSIIDRKRNNVQNKQRHKLNSHTPKIPSKTRTVRIRGSRVGETLAKVLAQKNIAKPHLHRMNQRNPCPRGATVSRSTRRTVCVNICPALIIRARNCC